MSTVNPFAAPQSAGFAPQQAESYAGGVWRDGNVLVMDKQAVLPHRCIKCNAPGSVRLKRKLRWHEPWLALFGWIVMLLVSKTAKIEVSLCEQHNKSRLIGAWVGGGVIAIGVVLMLVGFSQDWPPVGLAGFVLLIVGAITSATLSVIVKPKKIDKQYVWLEKVGPQFLAQFPPA